VLLRLLFFSASFAAIGAEAPDWPTIQVVEVARGVDLPTGVTHAGDGSGRLFVTEQAGRIRVVQGTNLLATPFLDLTDRVQLNPEQGLLGLAFPPGGGAKNHFYVNYTKRPTGDTVVSRFFVSTDQNIAVPTSEEVLLTYAKPTMQHNGGCIAFGPDGFLYVATGDGGGDCTVNNAAQNKQSLLGKILRLDVESHVGGYSIPPSNPFAFDPTYRPEIWALGLRNPWRIGFDRLTGDLFIADVGLFTRDEVNRQSAQSSGGENYGWCVLEGRSDWNVSPGTDVTRFTMPIYDHATGPGPAIIGGLVYRGARFPRMQGLYFFSDFAPLGMWALYNDGVKWVRHDVMMHSPFEPFPFLASAFGETEDGELLIADHKSVNGRILRVEDSGECYPPHFRWTAAYAPAVPVDTATPSAQIHFTTESREPTATDPSVISGGSIPVTLGATIRARTFRQGLLPSASVEVTFASFEVAAPSVEGNLTSAGLAITLKSETPDANLFYETDGTTPTSESPVYPGPFVVPWNASVVARGFKEGYTPSAEGRLNSPIFRSIAFNNGSLQVLARLPSPIAYQLQASADLKTWRTHGDRRYGPADDAAFTYSGATNHSGQQFFRILPITWQSYDEVP